jgi:hypothetical protein
MDTFIEQAIKKSVSGVMGNPETMATIAVYVQKLRDGFFKHRDIVFQKFERFGEFDIYDAYPFMQVHALLTCADVVCATLVIGKEAAHDKNIKANNEALHTLVYPFSGKFWGGTQDEDGYIDVKEDIEFDMINKETGERVTGMYSGRFPLEVGYLSAAKTLFYLNGPVGRIARWAYGSENIYLFQRRKLDLTRVLSPTGRKEHA